MRRVTSIIGVLAAVLLLPTVVFAQAQIAGIVKDTSGSVLPGVSVEAASPALIEKTRSVVTDGTGQYKIVDLRPGTYTVTFTLAGFNTVKRTGVELTGAFVATINADLKVGTVEETVTVVAETPVVDLQSVTTERVLSMNTVNSLPAGRNFDQIAQFIPGVGASGSGARNIGNVLGGQSGDGLEFHGTVNADSRVTVNGISVMTLQAGGGLGRSHPDLSTASEVAIDTSSVSADLPVGGVRMNLIPRDGGNDWHLSAINSYANSALQGNNFTNRLAVAGLAGTPQIDYNWDLNGGFGGPIKKDKVWFWFAGRKALLGTSATVFTNQNAYDPTKWTYLPSTTLGENKGRYQTAQLRTTWQATPRNKIALTYKYDGYCQCPSNVNSTISPEAGPDNRNPRLRQYHAEWTAPITNKLLFESVSMYLFERWGGMNQQGAGSLEDPALQAIQPLMISTQELTTGLQYRNVASTNGGVGFANNTLVPNYALRQAVSYVTGAHSIKVGLNESLGFLDEQLFMGSTAPVAYQLRNGAPAFILEKAWPFRTKTDENMDFGAFVQDKWTVNKFTVNGALRYDQLHTSAPAQTIGPSALTPNGFPPLPYKDLLQWKDLSYRSGVVWDVQGDGKTAVRVSFNKYLNGQTLNGIGRAPSPANTLVTAASRSWNDLGGLGINGDFVPQCDLTNNKANGECGATSPSNFGGTIPGTKYDPNLLSGYGVRPYNYEFSASVQREIAPRVSVDIGYFRRIFGNFNVTDNTNISMANYDTFSITTPVDPKLPGGGGQVLPGLLNIKPASFTIPQANLVELDSVVGSEKQHWNGMDFNANARLRNGLTIMGGVSTGKTLLDMCSITSQLPEMLFGTGTSNLTSFPVTAGGVWTPTQMCRQESPFLTQFKLQSVYTIPRIDVRLSGAYADAPGPVIQANYVATNAVTSPGLGRPLSGGASSMTVNMVQPGDMYGERLHNLDFSFGKLFNVGVTRLNVRGDIYNLLNKDTVVALNNNYGAWQKPIDLVPARFMKITVQLDF